MSDDHKPKAEPKAAELHGILAEYDTPDQLISAAEKVKKAGFDVLLLTDPVDSFAINSLTEYAGKPLVSVTAEDLKLPGGAEAEAEAKVEPSPAAEGLFTRFRDVLKEKVTEVRASKRLTDSPACLVQAEGALPPPVPT